MWVQLALINRPPPISVLLGLQQERAAAGRLRSTRTCLALATSVEQSLLVGYCCSLLLHLYLQGALH